MSIIIKKIDTLRDGGTICIDAWIHYNGETIEGESPVVSIDYSINTDTEGQWYLGLKSKGGKLLTDENLKKELVQETEEYLKRQTSIVNKIKESQNPPIIETTPYL